MRIHETLYASQGDNTYCVLQVKLLVHNIVSFDNKMGDLEHKSTNASLKLVPCWYNIRDVGPESKKIVFYCAY